MTLSKASGMQHLRTNIHSSIYIKGKNKQLPNCRHPLDLPTHVWYIYAVYQFPYDTNTYTHNTYTWILCLSIDRPPISPFKMCASLLYYPSILLLQKHLTKSYFLIIYCFLIKWEYHDYISYLVSECFVVCSQ